MKKGFNLLIEHWIPVRFKSGKTGLISPALLTQSEDPPISLNAPRADFNGALMEFLIGLLQTAVAPQDTAQWGAWMEQPPEPETLREKFLPFTQAFELRGESVNFMQDFEPIEGEPKPVSVLLIDAPGAKSVKDHTDHFIKGGLIKKLCSNCAASALFTLQSYAPSGGVGHRTSLRGGGPLTTLVALDTQGSQLEAMLWRDLWLNVQDEGAFTGDRGGETQTHRQLSDIFPWLAPTRTSEAKTGQDTFLEQVNPLQMFWGMPRRIRLVWQQYVTHCDLCGVQTEVVCEQFVTKNYGINYNGVWQHPLSPHYIDKKTGQPMPVHAQQEGLGYRHWLGFTQATEGRKPARVVALFSSSRYRRLPKENLRLNAFGYDMDNMKVRNWHQIQYPLYQIPDDAQRQDFARLVDSLIASADLAAGFCQSGIKEAWFKRPKDVRGDTGFIKQAFYQRTEVAFYHALERLHRHINSRETTAVQEQWYQILKKTATRLFDEWATRGDISVSDPRRIVKAHEALQKRLNSKKFLEALKITRK
jgi:CRISPR system Cascade subunit CasA